MRIIKRTIITLIYLVWFATWYIAILLDKNTFSRVLVLLTAILSIISIITITTNFDKWFENNLKHDEHKKENN